MNRKEIQNIASRIGMHEKSFLVQYVDERVDDTGKHFHSLKKHHTKNQCIFLNGSKCSIYNDRPTQCRTYPYWPHVMIGDAEWKGEARNCEGILLDSLRSRLDLAPKVDVDTVALNMIVHQIHDRGLGENWTYDEAVELLMDSKKDSPELFDDYLKGFYEDSESYTGNHFM